MSWILSVIGTYTKADLKLFESIHPNPIDCYRTQKKYLACGGIPGTCFFENNHEQDSGWMVCGLGINSKFELMEHHGWQSALANQILNQNSVIRGGHYIVIRWRGDKMHCFNDPLGLRDIYLAKWKNLLILSTELAWISRVTKYHSLNLKNFGSAWLLTNQLSHKSVLTNIERLGPGGFFTFENESYAIKREMYHPKFTNQVCDFPDLLKKYILLTAGNSCRFSLGLSGGLDSRCLLSILLNSKLKNWAVHSFGNSRNPDVRIAGQIALHFTLNHTLFEPVILSVDECLTFIKQNIGRTALSVPASEIINLKNYDYLRKTDKTVIDGGFGEITRRQYLNRLLLIGKRALKNHNVDAIAAHLRHFKGNIFDFGTVKVFKEGVKNDIMELLNTMPDLKSMEIGNWLDLLSVRTRLPNFFGFAQAHADNHVINFMPYVQPEILDAIFQIPITQRTNGKLLKSIIRKNNRDLTKFKLVKFNTEYSFYCPSVLSYLYTMGKAKLGRIHNSTVRISFLYHLKEYIQDMVHSESVKSNPLFDYSYIENMINQFYKGEHQYQGELDWWLAFDLFQQSISSTSV
jgi:hypothetical protein